MASRFISTDDKPLIIVDASEPAKTHKGFYECYKAAVQPLSSFESLEHFLSAQSSYCYHSARLKSKLNYSLSCQVCKKAFKWLPPLIAHTLPPEQCNVFHYLNMSNMKTSKCQFCNLELCEAALEFHNFSRHVSQTIFEMDDSTLITYVKEMVSKYIVAFCDKCFFSIRGKWAAATTADMFLRHWKLCRDYPNNSMELSKLQFACPVCLKRFALASFVKHNGCGPPVSLEEAQEALSYAEVQSTRIDSSKPLSKKRQSIARCIDFKDVYGSTPADDSFTDAEFNPVPVVNDTDTGLADQGVSESGAGVSPAETSQSQALCESVSTKPTDPKYAASSTRRAFSMVELTTQGIAEQGYIKTLQLLGTLFPNLKPEKEDHKDVETEFVTNETVANSISKIKLASVEIMCPEDYKSDFLNGGEDMVLSTGGKIVAIAITHTAGSYYILLSTKNANKKYPVSLNCSETHYQQLWELSKNEEQPFCKLQSFLTVSGLSWQLRFLDAHLTSVDRLMNNIAVVAAASSAGFITLTPFNLTSIDTSPSKVKWKAVKLATESDLGQCFCVDFNYFSSTRSRVLGGFANGCIAIWVLKNEKIQLDERQKERVLLAQIVFPAHRSYVNDVAWNLHNHDHFASVTPMIEDSLKVWNFANFMDGPIFASTGYQFVGVSQDAWISGFNIIASHGSLTKCTLPASVTIFEDELYFNNVKLTHHEKLEALAVTSHHFPHLSPFMFVTTEEGYVFRSNSRVRFAAKKEKVFSCPIVMSASYDPLTQTLRFQDKAVTVKETQKFPPSQSLVTTVAAYSENYENFLVCTGFESGICRVKFMHCSNT